jgi:hypothetical protein
MKHPSLNLILGALVAMGALTAPVAAQAPAPATKAAKLPWPPKLTEDGQPDVQGFWVAKDYGMGCLTNPKDSDVGCVPSPDVLARGKGNSKPKPTSPSRIIDTPDHEIPYTAEARTRQKYLLKNYYEPTSQAHIDPQQLCLPLGPVRQLTWHDVHIFQYPGYVIFIHEGGHSWRVIPLDGRPHIGNNLKLWMGDSRGHWEGTTLVVDVTNYNGKGRFSRAGDFSSDKIHITERFEFLDGDNLRYAAKIEDPSTYTRPWTFGFDLKRDVFGSYGVDQETYEHWEEACYEGMHDIDRSLRTSEATKPKE